MGYRVLGNTEELYKGYGPRKGLEGPFVYPNGQVLYYDPREGKYYDPTTDIYVEYEDVQELQTQVLSLLVGRNL
jgi:hypothetical protein